MIADSITLRRPTPADEAFLLRLYATTRIVELESLNWSAGQKEAFIQMQFDAQLRSYESNYPDADNQIILRGNEPIGRILIDRGRQEFVLIDIAVLPQHRNQGIGNHLLGELLNEAAAVAKPVRLHVLKSNSARRLYERLGFILVGEDGMYCEMVWEPQD